LRYIGEDVTHAIDLLDAMEIPVKAAAPEIGSINMLTDSDSGLPN
jgi:hypothetical protein